MLSLPSNSSVLHRRQHHHSQQQPNADHHYSAHGAELAQPMDRSHHMTGAGAHPNRHISIADSIPDVHAMNIARTSKSFHVVIIGGSFAGIRAAQELEVLLPPRMVTITVIDRRDQYFYNLGALRALVKPELIDMVWLPYDHIFRYPHNRVIQGDAASVYPNSVILKDGRKIDFDSLLVATGSIYPRPCKVETTSHAKGKAELRMFGDMVRVADSILIIGGGPTGVGLAAEIATVYPKKIVMLVHAGERLMSSEYSSKAVSRKAYKKLKSMGVKVILGERVIIPEDEPLKHQVDCRWLKTTKGRRLFSSVQFLCNGITFETSLMDTLDPVFKHNIVDPATGQIRVLPTMQLNHPELPWVFSAGDVCDTAGEKQAYRADSQGSHVAKCMARMAQAWAQGHSQWFDVPLKHWHDPAQFMSVAMGPTAGVTDTPWIVLGDMPTRILKSRELFLARRYREFNLEFPGVNKQDGLVHDLADAKSSDTSLHHKFSFMSRHTIEQRIRARGGVATNPSNSAYGASNAVANAAIAAADHLDHRHDIDRVSLSRPLVRRPVPQGAMLSRADPYVRQYVSASESDGNSSDDNDEDGRGAHKVPLNQYVCTTPLSQRQGHSTKNLNHPLQQQQHERSRTTSLDTANTTTSESSSTHTGDLSPSSSSVASHGTSHTSTLHLGPVLPRYTKDRSSPVTRSFHKSQDFFEDGAVGEGHPPIPPLPHTLISQMSNASISPPLVPDRARSYVAESGLGLYSI
ncbi:hypothetical protein IWW39_005447 [Coemansia spiralis]|uniref:FAD/NAD(P)-binding domain-containing protein n=1 Tax=Coemansia spiralis TaxID=417178 RepID=A0A9W8L0Q8_9FUNG|nr:hypothetical protein IWW39_005447 [Coemansia spiralis]